MEMGFPASISLSVGIVTLGMLILGIARMFRNSKHRNDTKGNPGNRVSVSPKECTAYRNGFDKQIKATEKVLSNEIKTTRDVLVREIGEIKEELNRRES